MSFINSYRFASAAVPPTRTFLSQLFGTTAGATHTFLTYGISTASATRRVVMVVTGYNGGPVSLSSATIGGVSATIHSQDNTEGDSVIALISAVVPTGTTATVALTFSASVATSSIAGWACYDLVNSAPSATSLTDGTTVGSDPQTLTISAPANSVVIAGFYQIRNPISASGSWSVLTSRYNASSGFHRVVGADTFLTSANASFSSTLTLTTNHGGGLYFLLFAWA